MEAIRSSEQSVLIKSTQRLISEDGILYFIAVRVFPPAELYVMEKLIILTLHDLDE
jgi:hypothetical protein